MYRFRQVEYDYTIVSQGVYVLGADIGGTNSNFGFFCIVNHELQLHFSWHYKSQDIDDFADLVRNMLDQVKSRYGITIAYSCFAVAGVVIPGQNFCKPTNLKIEIRADDLIARTSLAHVLIVNDFEVIGYGIPLLDQKDIHVIHQGVEHLHGNKAIFGAGTGLGKTILHWIGDTYIAVASEGGHADCAVQTQQELDFIKFVQQQQGVLYSISWEDVLSGNGIQRMHRFFSMLNNDIDDKELPPDEIFARRNDDKRARETFELYTILYARCAKNFALDALALGGLYIVGGIAAKNIHLFELEQFRAEFIKCGKQGDILKNIPLWVIADYNVSLYGAAKYLLIKSGI